MIQITIAYIIDLIVGDPQGAFHPIKLIGKLISMLEKKLRKLCKTKNDELIKGGILFCLVILTSYIVPYLIIYITNLINIKLSIIVEIILCYYIFATKSLKTESMKVYYSLKNNSIEKSREYLSYIVGRDVNNLDEEKISKATVETIAENTCDGVIAPIIFTLIGGVPLGYMYKAVNTLDSMIGYKNEKYFYFGKVSAIADDIVNYIPARISSYIMILASYIKKYDYKNAYKIYKRDRYNHLSPNSAQTESVCAGALHIMLGGGSFYKGKYVDKKTIGDNNRSIEKNDIVRANKLMYTSSIICVVVGLTLKFIIEI